MQLIGSEILWQVKDSRRIIWLSTRIKKLVAWESTWHREEDGPFFKVYLQGVDDLHAVKGALDVLVELCKQMDRAAEGSLIRITRFDREAISKKCNITEGHFKNIITALVKRNVLKRIANQIYAMNPTIIAKGYPEEVLSCARNGAIRMMTSRPSSRLYSAMTRRTS